MKTKPQIDRIITTMRDMFPPIRTELDYATPFQLLIAVILSAQTTDKQVNKTTPSLFSRVREARDMLVLDPNEVEHLVRSVNFYRNKAKFIYGCAERLVRDFDGIIPNDLTVLQTFPGIGIKTAKVVLSVLYDAPYVGVDTHIHRVANRIGIVRTKTAEETDKALDRKLTIEQKLIAHHPIVLFGRYHCTARKPKCPSCPIRDLCDYKEKTGGLET